MMKALNHCVSAHQLSLARPSGSYQPGEARRDHICEICFCRCGSRTQLFFSLYFPVTPAFMSKIGRVTRRINKVPPAGSERSYHSHISVNLGRTWIISLYLQNCYIISAGLLYGKRLQKILHLWIPPANIGPFWEKTTNTSLIQAASIENRDWWRCVKNGDPKNSRMVTRPFQRK